MLPGMSNPPEAPNRAPAVFTERRNLCLPKGTGKRIAQAAAADDPPLAVSDWLRRAIVRALLASERRRGAAPRRQR